MKLLPVNRLLALVVTLSTALSAPALHGQEPAGASVPVERIAREQTAGKYLAFHFIKPDAGQQAQAHINEYMTRWPEVAGVRHVFVLQENVPGIEVKSGDADPVWVMQGDAGAVAGAFKINLEVMSPPEMTIIDPTRKELFHTESSANASGHQGFDVFAKRMARQSRAPEVKEYNIEGTDAAIQGYDPVSYFSGAPKKGNPAIQSTWMGVTYQFSSKENREQFALSPDKFTPEYGGWCATAMAKGDKVKIDPETYKVTDGRLFLFYNFTWGNALKDWVKDEPRLTTDADKHWAELTR